MSYAQTALEQARRSWPWIVVVGVALIIAGIAALARPLVGGVAVTIFVGWLMIFAGMSHFFSAAAGAGFGQVLLRLILGVIYVAAGVWLLNSPGEGLQILTLVLGISLILDGITTFFFTFALPSFMGKGVLFLSATFSILAGIIIWVKWPASSELVIGILLGIRLLFAGASFLMLGLGVKDVADT